MVYVKHILVIDTDSAAGELKQALNEYDVPESAQIEWNEDAYEIQITWEG